MKHRYSEQQLREAIALSTSIRQALQLLGVAARGGNYGVIRKAVKTYNIDTSHFTGQGHARGKIIGPKRDINLYLSNSVPIGSDRLRKRLLSEGILQPMCASCTNDTWLGSPIPLELDHINGNSLDNTLTNLRLLCPNCHAFTPTYRGKNKNKIQT